MARIARKDYDTSYFHVIVQGYEKQRIFENNYLIEKYLDLLTNELTKFKVTILAYCIMNNHAHILLYTESINEMSKFMKKVNSKYAIYYNKINKRVGYVFRDRFLSEPIMNEKYLFNCLCYIHMNPVAACIVKTMRDYKYSSYKDFLCGNGIINSEALKILFGSSKDYMELFNYIHKGSGMGIEYKKDDIRPTCEEASEIIDRILKKYYLSKEELNDEKILRYFLKKFMDCKINKSQIEKIMKINRKKLTKIINSI